ncbi:MAG TPA: ankyrin repeat domain-containing protein [Candidatus Angelobacter sp.]|nr:ankyrin repeat domain-containing protein [Candidatus Angelobacter sp.]
MAFYELHQAVKKGDLHRVSDLLNESPLKIDINQGDHKGWTPLMYAVARPEARIEILHALIRHGANIDQTSLSFALSDLQKLSVLVEAGADVRYEKEQGYDTLIDAACRPDVLHNPQLIEILSLLIANGVSLRGMTAYKESSIRVLSRVGRFDAVHLLLKAGANPNDIKFTPLMEAVTFGSLAEVAALAESGADLEERDYWERTAWLIAIQTGDIPKAKFLLGQGSDKSARGRCGKPPLFYAIENGHAPMLRWLLEIGTDIEHTDDFGETALKTAVECRNDESIDILLAAGANVNQESQTGTPLGFADTRGIAMKLMEAGADPRHLSGEGRRSILGYPSEPDQDLLEASATEFQQGRSRRFGAQNPEIMNNPFWQGMIRAGLSAYQAGTLFGVENKFDGKYEPIWCAQRFGQSITFLPDGRIVQVAGEHEDHYDPDFCIYNDVFVHDADGRITIYGYPESVFPPTDFHTATLIDNYVYLIGSLGYRGTRQYGEISVYRLDTTTFRIERMETSGDKPGWIYNHRAMLSRPHEIRVFGGEILSSANDNDKEVHSKNLRSFLLDIERRVWRTESK